MSNMNIKEMKNWRKRFKSWKSTNNASIYSLKDENGTVMLVNEKRGEGTIIKKWKNVSDPENCYYDTVVTLPNGKKFAYIEEYLEMIQEGFTYSLPGFMLS